MTNTNERFDEQLTWEQRLQYPTRVVTFHTQPNVKEYILSHDEIQELNKLEKNLLLDQAIEIGEKMKERCNKAECAKNELGGCDPMDMVGQYISKLKELKE